MDRMDETDPVGGRVADPTGPVRRSPAVRAIAAWSTAEFYLGTAVAERRWDEFRAAVRGARRAYAWSCLLMGLVVGAGGGIVAGGDGIRPGRHVLSVVVAYLSGPALAWWWGRLMRWSIAPVLFRNAQRFARLAYALAQTIVLAVSPLFAAHPTGWGVAAAVLIALPWLVSAYLESHRALPPYPAAWKDFTTG